MATLKFSKIDELFSKEAPITQVYLQQRYNDAINILRKSNNIKKMGYKEDKPIIEVEPPAQASDDEIACAIADKTIEL